MKNILFFALLITSYSFSQDYLKDVSRTNIKNIAEKVSFEPVKRKMDKTQFLSLILQLPEDVFKQLNINAWYICKNRQEENYNIWNLYYNKISRESYNIYCKELNILMMIDGTVIQPR